MAAWGADGAKVDGRLFWSGDSGSGISTVPQASPAILRMPGAAASSRFVVTDECY